MAEKDWASIASEYAEGKESLYALARRHGLPYSTLRGRARREGWQTRRPGRDESASHGAAGPEAGEDGAARIFRVTDKLVRRAEEILDGEEAVGAREIGELMRAIKNAKEIKMLRSPLDEREQLARLRALEEKLETAPQEALRIEFSPEAEEAAY